MRKKLDMNQDFVSDRKRKMRMKLHTKRIFIFKENDFMIICLIEMFCKE